jgi:hypothetical protein
VKKPVRSIRAGFFMALRLRPDHACNHCRRQRFNKNCFLLSPSQGSSTCSLARQRHVRLLQQSLSRQSRQKCEELGRVFRIVPTGIARATVAYCVNGKSSCCVFVSFRGMIETIEFILTDERFYAPLTPPPDDNAVPVSNIIRLLKWRSFPLEYTSRR